jgi:pentatricopeptide repeat protein
MFTLMITYDIYSCAAQVKQLPNIDAQVFSKAISACADTGAWETALTLLNMVKLDRRMRVTIECFNGCIVACGKKGQWVKALSLLREAEDMVSIYYYYY